MTRTTWALAALTLTLATACKHNPPDVALPAQPTAQHPVAPAPDAARQAAVDQLVANFERVHFDTDSSRLTDGAREALAANAEILTEYVDLKVEVQGHADERGTIDYNLALGQRRARAVVDYLSNLNVSRTRLPMVSYGEERPLEEGLTEVAWSLNRRAEFRIVGASPPVEGTTDR